MIQVPEWSAYPWLRHGFSERRGGFSTIYGAPSSQDGDLNLGFTPDDNPSLVRENRVTVVRALAGGSPVELITARQVHGVHVQLLLAGDTGLWTPAAQTCDGRATLETDGLITSVPGFLLGIQVADCVPVLAADTRLRIVTAFHAGWRGTAAAIVERGIARMRAEFGSAPGDLVAAIGPAIGVCCYAVGQEVQTRFEQCFPYAADLFEQRADATYLNLAEANRRQLLQAGLPAERIWLAHQCTACTRVGGRRRFFSHRAEQGVTGRAMGLIGIR